MASIKELALIFKANYFKVNLMGSREKKKRNGAKRGRSKITLCDRAEGIRSDCWLIFCQLPNRAEAESKVAVIGTSTHGRFLIEMEDKVVVSLFSPCLLLIPLKWIV